MAMKRTQRFFLLKFFAILIVGFLVVTTAAVEQHVVIPLTSVLASFCGGILTAIGEPVAVLGTRIMASGFGVEILLGCNGVEAMLILVASIFAFPASARSRVIGVVVGSVAIQVVNVVRILSLFLLGKYHREIFDLFHSAVWQVLIILVSLGIFLLWSTRFAKPAKMADAA